MTLQDYFAEHSSLQNQWAADKNPVSPVLLTPQSHDKVWWRCEQGHSWQAMIFSRTNPNGTGCPYCAGKKAIPGKTDLATLRPDLIEQWDFEKNTEKPEQKAVGSHDKVWWKCVLGHSWQAMIFSRTGENSAGCPYCTGKKVLPGFNDLATLKPKVAREWHPTMNSGLHPENVTPGSNKKVWWQCRDGHVWQAAVYSRTRKKGSSCPVCAGTVKRNENVRHKTMRGSVHAGASIRLK